MGDVGLACRCLLGAVFLVSFVTKVGAYRAFVVSLHTMRVVPSGLVGSVAAVVVGGEAVVVGALVWTPSARVGAVVAVVLLVGFSVGIGVVLRARSVAVCRCFGASGGVLGRRHLVRNAVLVVVALAVVGGGASASVSLVAVVSGLVGALLVVGLDPVVEVFGRSV